MHSHQECYQYVWHMLVANVCMLLNLEVIAVEFPTNVLVDSHDGMVYVTTAADENCRIRRFRSDGTLLHTWGGDINNDDDEEELLSDTTGMAIGVCSGSGSSVLYVCDSGNGRIVVISIRG
jgi:hypothetical protein